MLCMLWGPVQLLTLNYHQLIDALIINLYLYTALICPVSLAGHVQQAECLRANRGLQLRSLHLRQLARGWQAHRRSAVKHQGTAPRSYPSIGLHRLPAAQAEAQIPQRHSHPATAQHWAQVAATEVATGLIASQAARGLSQLQVISDRPVSAGGLAVPRRVMVPSPRVRLAQRLCGCHCSTCSRQADACLGMLQDGPL